MCLKYSSWRRCHILSLQKSCWADGEAEQGDVRQPCLGSSKGRWVSLALVFSGPTPWIGLKEQGHLIKRFLKSLLFVSEAPSHNDGVWCCMFWELQADWLSSLPPCIVSHLLKLLDSTYREVSGSHFCGLLTTKKFGAMNSSSSINTFLLIHGYFPCILTNAMYFVKSVASAVIRGY